MCFLDVSGLDCGVMSGLVMAMQLTSCLMGSTTGSAPASHLVVCVWLDPQSDCRVPLSLCWQTAGQNLTAHYTVPVASMTDKGLLWRLKGACVQHSVTHCHKVVF